MTKAQKSSFLDYVPIAIIISDSNSRIKYSNKVAEEVLKLPRDALLQTPLAERVHPTDRQKVKQYAEALKRQKHMITRRRFKTGDGKYVVIERNTQLLEDGSQLSICRVVPSEEDEEGSKERIASMLGHELRNPLGGIRMSIDLIGAQLDAPENSTNDTGNLKDLVSKTQSQIDLLNRMLGDLLEFSLLQRGTLQLRKSRFELRQFISDILTEIRATSGRKFSSTISDTAPQFLYADRDRLYQVCMNLLWNAVKYSNPPKPIELNISAENATCILEVRDYGIGIPKKHRDLIFNDFYQIKQSGDESGLGIGLSIVNEIVKLHGGSVEVKSHGKNKGSTFRVYLPIKGGSGHEKE